MIRLAAILAIAASSGAVVSVDECPASLVQLTRGLTSAELGFSNRYARCISIPWLPTAQQFAEKTISCRGTLASARR